MTNQELKTLNNRQQLEYNYKLNNPSKIKKGMAIVGGITAGLGALNALYKNSNNLKRNSNNLINTGRNIYDKYRYQRWLYKHADSKWK